MPVKIAFLFPGQGSQYAGMGRELADRFPEAGEIFKQVDDICERPISRLCYEGPMEELTLTVNLQPAVTAVNLACLAVLNKAGVSGSVSAGHSLGEYSALTSAGVITSYDALRLVKKRGELMHREAMANPGAMAAVVGMEIEKITDIVASSVNKGVIAVANHNSAQQIVISGEKEALSYAVDLVKREGAKAIPLQVSGAWHCSLMKNAVKDFRQFMQEISFERPKTAILFNATARVEDDPEEIKDIMARQLISPVKWYDIILEMMRDGVGIFVEVGPKKVLTGLLNKIIPKEGNLKVYNVEDLRSLDVFLSSF
ncbi:MAG: [acyl-carrier-protein] S-malonyltransferase [Deltaproteobacteria bacterium RBG_19FT_COMBO_46_9]|nr:MAG: [acyl-carrier-protein] S-malonyltransferase [Deltaproteobacteria bacterium RBG_19FT_COMBO_46_9]